MKFSAYFLGKGKKVEEQYFEGSSVEDATSQAKAYAKKTGQTFSSLWQLQRLSAAGRPIVSKEAKGRLDDRAGGAKGEYGSDKSYGSGYKNKK